MLDALQIWRLPKDKPLPIHEGSKGFTCAIHGCEQDAHAWRVTLPERAGPACPGCAQDAGFTVR